MSTHADLLQLAAVCGVVGGGLIVRAIKSQKEAQMVADTPRSKVASAPQGFVELEGFAWPCDETVSTIDGEEAVYYVLQLQREERSGKSSSWVTVFTYEHIVPFYLIDPTGIAVVQPANADVELTRFSTKSFSGLNEKSRAALQQFVGDSVANFPPSSFASFVGVSNFRIVEKKLIVGSPLVATGNFVTESYNQLTIDSSLSTFAKKVFDFNSRSLKNVTRILDTNHDGFVSAEEALAGYTTAARLSRMNPNKNETSPLEVFGNLKSSTEHKLFFADKHEKQLIESLTQNQFLKLSAGAGLIAISVCLALLQFGVIKSEFYRPKASFARAPAQKSRSNNECELQSHKLNDRGVPHHQPQCSDQ